MTLQVIFMGTPEYSVATLVAIAEAGHEIKAVYTKPPQPSGRRGLNLVQSSVHQKAETLNIPVYTPLHFHNHDIIQHFRALKADVAIVVAYGLLLPDSILDAPKFACLNAHASLLPRWRGAAPIQRAIMAGDRKTGVMIMKMEKGLDTGPIALTREISIDPEVSADQLHDRLSVVSSQLILEALDKLESGSLSIHPQSVHGVSYARKIAKSETRIDWNKSAHILHNQIRALSPFPSCWFEMPCTTHPDTGQMVRIKTLRSELVGGRGKPGEILDDNFTIACGNDAIRIIQLQRMGKRPSGAAEYLRGNPLAVGTVLD